MNQEIRLILTQACNYNCYFCHHEGVEKIKENKLNYEDIAFLYNTYYKFYNSNTITLTGGEPFLRKDLIPIVKELYKCGCNTTIVTNGSLLLEKIEVCKYIKKLNISLHSLKKQIYENITDTKNEYENVIHGISIVREKYPSLEININYAITYSPQVEMNKKIKDILEFARKHSVNIKFIEIFPRNNKTFFEIEKLEEILINNKCEFVKNENRKKLYLYKNNKVYITKCLCANALEYEDSEKFCNQNNDLFIAQDGTIKPCRLQHYEISIYDDIKNRNEENLFNSLKVALNNLGKNCPYIKEKG